MRRTLLCFASPKAIFVLMIMTTLIIISCRSEQISIQELDKLLETPINYRDLSHHVTAQFSLEDHGLEAEDVIQLERLQDEWATIIFLLDSRLSVYKLKVNEKDIKFKMEHFYVMSQYQIAKIIIPDGELPRNERKVTLVFKYGGTLWNNDDKYQGGLITNNVATEGIYNVQNFNLRPTIFGTSPDNLLTLSLPRDWKLACNGQKEEININGETIAYRIDFGPWDMSFAAADYVTTSTIIGDRIPLSVFFTPQDSVRVSEISETSEKVLMYFSERFGTYPYEELIIAEVISGKEGGGVAGEGMVFLSEDYFRNTPTSILLSHELSHNWWGSHIKPKNWLADMWLAEGLATYSQALYGEWEGGPWLIQNYLGGFEGVYRRIPNYLDRHFWISLFEKEPAITFFDPTGRTMSPIIYNKGAFVFHMLRRVVGDSTFFEILREYAKTYGGGKASISDFEQVCSKVSGQDLNWFVEQWVERPGAPKLALEDVQVKVNPDSTETSVSGYLVQQGKKIFKFPVEIALDTDAGEIRHTVWMEKNKQKFIIKANTGKVFSLLIDPDNNLLDLRKVEEYVITPPTVKHIRNTGTGLWGHATPTLKLSLSLGENEGIHFYNILGIVVDRGGNIFVLDIRYDEKYRLIDKVLYKFDRFGRHLLSMREKLGSPRAVAIDNEDCIYILENKQKVFKYSNLGNYLFALDIKLKEAQGLSIDKKNDIYVYPNPFFDRLGKELVHKYDQNGKLLSMFVKRKNHEDLYTENDLNRYTLCATVDGIFVSYRYAYEVRKYNFSGSLLFTFDRQLPWKIPNLISAIKNPDGRGYHVGGLTPSTIISSACDRDGNLYLLLGGENWDYEKPEGNQIIDVFNKDGLYLGKMETGQGGFYHIYIDPDKNIYLAGSNRVCRYFMREQE